MSWQTSPVTMNPMPGTPAPGPQAYLATPVQRRSGRAVVLAALGGLLLGALIVGLLWLTIGGSGGTGGSSESISAPTKIGQYQQFGDVKINQSPPGKATADRTKAWNARSAETLSDSYGGAGAVVQTYASEDLGVIFSLTMVRARSPGFYVPYEDPAALGMKAPQQEVKQFGGVQCVLHNQSTASGSDAQVQVLATDCQRTGADLTVRIMGATGDLGKHPDQVAALVDQAWSSVN